MTVDLLQRLVTRIGLLALCGFCCVNDAGAAPWLRSDEYGDVHVVIGEGASESEEHAAELFQQHWRTTTGHEVPIANAPAAGRVNVWIGRAGNPYAGKLPLDGLGDDGIVVRTVSDENGKSLHVVGGEQRGTLYGVVHFFEEYMGMRWLSFDAFRVPDPPEALPRIRYRYVPPFWYRDISYRAFVNVPWLAGHSRLNGFWANAQTRWGGKIMYARGFEGMGHTFHYFVDPEEYFDEHPEYFAEVAGERREDGQLCLTNTDVLAITIEKVRDVLRDAAPNERFVSVSQMDVPWFDSWCTCTNCKAVDDYEESHSGTIVRFVNAIADAVADEFPDAFIDTFAYQYSRRPPKHARPRDNVVVRLCPIECDYSRPLSDRSSAVNRAFVKDLKGWSRITDTLFIWDYTQNWYSHQGPHPNFHVLQPNAKLFAKHGVKGVFEQASWESPHSDYEILKGYLLSHALWDPEGDWREAYDEFIDEYYGDAGPYIHEYLDLIASRVRQDDVVLTFNNRMRWMDYDLVVRAQAIFARAFENVRDETLRERLDYAYLPVQYAALVCPPKVFRAEDAYILTRPPSQTFDEYWDMILRYGVTRLEDHPIDAFRERLKGETPPRYERVPIERLQNGQTEIWVLPTRGGAIVRWRDTASGADLLNGFEDPTSAAGTIGTRIIQDDEVWARPRALDVSFEVVSRSDSRIAMLATLDNGVTIREEIAFTKSGRGIELLTQVTNGGDEAIETDARIRVDLSAAGNRSPRIRRETEEGWARTALRPGSGGSLTVAGGERTRVQLRKQHIAVTSDAAAEGGTLRFRRNGESIRHEYSLGEDPIAPGETQRAGVRLEIAGSGPRGRQ